MTERHGTESDLRRAAHPWRPPELADDRAALASQTFGSASQTLSLTDRVAVLESQMARVLAAVPRADVAR